MRYDSIEPLEAGIWLQQLEKLAADLPKEEGALITSLRRGFHLVQLTPRPLRHIVACSATEDEFERLLESDDLLPATTALVGDKLSYSLRLADAEGGAVAEVWFPNDPESSHAEGSSAPFALFAAWLECLVTLHELDDAGEWARSPGRRKSQSGRRRKLTEH